MDAHSILWGCKDHNDKGRKIEHFTAQHQLCLLNDGQPTYIHRATGNCSAMDISLCSASLFLDINWKVHEDHLIANSTTNPSH